MMRILKILLLASLCAAPAARAAAHDPPGSIYRLDARLTDQDGRTHGLDLHRGHPVLVTMFYSSCQATCPLIIDTLRAAERQVPAERRADLRVLMISFDPDKDTPAALAEVARTRRIDTSRWTLARADDATVRKIAALLDVQYRKLPNGEFNHAAVITLLSPSGEIEARTTRLGEPGDELAARLRAPPPGATN